MTLILRAPQSLTAPLPGNPVLPARVAISDGFGGANLPSIIGRVTDSALGGLPSVWEGTENAAAIVSNTLRRGANTVDSWFVGVPAVEPDHEVSVVINARPTGGSVIMDARRSSPMVAGTPDGYRLSIANTMYLQRRSGGSQTVVIESAVLPSVTVGKRYGVRVRGGLVEVTVDGVVVGSYTDPNPIAGPGWAGFGGANTVASFEFDSFIVRAATAA